MVNDNDTIAYMQYAARELPVPRFGKPLDIRGGNTKSIRSLAFSCDGKKAATGTEYKGIRIWNATLQPIEATGSYTLPKNVDSSPHKGHVAALAFSPTEPNVLVSGCKSSSSVVAVWDITKPSSAVASFTVPGDILHIAFHPSGAHFAVTCTRGSRDEAFFFWRSAESGIWTRREDIGLSGALGAVESEEINSLHFNKSGRLLCAVSNDGSANAWLYPTELVSRSPSPDIGAETADVEAGAEADDTREDDERKSRAVSPEEERADVTPKEGGGEGEVDADVAAEAAGNQDGDQAKASEADGAEVDAAGDVGQDVEMAEAGTEETAATAVAETPNGDVEMSSFQAPASGSTPPAPVSVAPSRQSSPPPPPAKAPVAPRSKAKPLKCVRHTICHSASLLSLSFDPAGRYMAIGGQDALLSLFDTQDWICQRTFDMFTAAIRHSAFSPDGELIALAGDDTFIAIVSVYSKQMIARIPVSSPVIALTWHSHHNWLAYCTSRSGLVWHMCCQEP